MPAKTTADAKNKSVTRTSTKVLTLGAAKDLKNLSYEAQRILADQPLVQTLLTTIRHCRRVSAESEFLKTYFPLKLSVYNYGFQLVPALNKGKPATSDDEDKLAEWNDELQTFQFEPYTDPATRQTVTLERLTTNREMVGKFAEDVWNEFNLLDFCPAAWNDDQGYASTILPELTTYTDLLGVPIMAYSHGLGPLDILKLPQDQQQRYRTFKTIVFDSKLGEHFKVLKRTREGDGYGLPSLFSVFTLLAETQSKIEGMSAMAYFLRSPRRHHKLGHEIKGGDRAGKPTHFWNKARAEAVMKSWDNKVGASDFTSNFDHDVEFPWPDLKVFDELAFKGSDKRLNNWGGPIMLMMQAKGVMPYLTTLLRAQATADRQKVGEFLAIIINASWKPPVPVRVQFSNMIFNEARLASELLKFAQQAGWLSAQTGKEEIGLNSAQEESRKVTEASDAKALQKFTPIWDTAHGSTPALGETAGKLAEAKAASAAKGPAAGTRPGNAPGTKHKT